MDYAQASTPTAEGNVGTICAAIELSTVSWLVAVRRPGQERASEYRLAPRDAAGLVRLLERARAALARRAAGPVTVVSCYEAGRDGFWLHRTLVAHGIDSRVLDPGSLRVTRRGRRAKSDRLDVHALLRALTNYLRGDRDECRMVCVPSVAEEDARRPHREHQRLVGERVAHVNRIKGLLATHGISGYQPLRADRHERLAALRCADGTPLPAALLAEVERELARLELVHSQIAALATARAAARKAVAASDAGTTSEQALVRVRGIGPEFASVLAREVFYRAFANRRALASYLGLTPTAFRSGRLVHEQGITKAGNRRARRSAIELVWLWLRHQPDSALTNWYRTRTTAASGRVKRIMIVALARKVLVALWRYLTTGLVPAGVRLKG